jgi:ribosomal-protein-alanine N-acetyltransferase
MNNNVNKCPNLETSRLLLRELSSDDADELFQVFSEEETTHYVPREIHIDKTDKVNHLEKELLLKN